MIRWSRLATAERRSQIDWLSERNPAAAGAMNERIDSAVGRLEAFPLSARKGRIFGTRELVVSRTPYIVVYRLTGTHVEILRLRHQSQGWLASIDFTDDNR